MKSALLLLIPALALAQTPPADPVAGHWEGQIQIPGMPIGVLVDLTSAGDVWQGTVDIPLQGAKGLKLSGIAVVADSVRFTIAGVPGDPTFTGLLADSAGVMLVKGAFTQGGQGFPFRLGRGAIARPRRPQEPQPPLPYRAEEVGYASGAVHLAATLTVPAGDGPFPAAVLLTGSGAQNRDEELFGHKFFLVLADYLTRAGIAVLRADDRGVGGSTGSVRGSTTSDFADDALAGIRFLRSRPEIDGRRLGLIGHSEGGIVGPLAAARAPDEVAFVVMIAGTGVPLDEVILRQIDRIATAAGEPAWRVAEDVGQARTAIYALKAGADSAAVRGELLAQVRAQAAARPDSLRLTEADIAQAVDSGLRGMLSPWFRFAIRLDPRAALRQVRCPVLAVNGLLDLQVDPEQNLPEIEKALREGGNRDVTILRLPGLNHALQTAKTGLPAEYGLIEETMNPAALAAIGDWILAR